MRFRRRAAVPDVTIRLVGALVLFVAATLTLTQLADRKPVSSAATSSRTGDSDSYAQRRDAALSRDAARPPLTGTRDHVVAQRMSRERAEVTQRLNEQSAERSRELAANRWVLPLSTYRLTGQFGASSSLWSSSHTGLDFAAPAGTPIRSVSRGVVSESGSAGAYGLRTVVQATDGTELWYCHQQATLVSSGDTIAAGEQIGEVGATGNVTGPHLHLEIRPSGASPVDPVEVLRQRGAGV